MGIVDGIHNISFTKINNKRYLTTYQFSILSNRKPEQIRRLIRNGNSIRNLEAIKLRGIWYIPVSELYNFPFVEPGAIGKEIRFHRYTENGGIDVLTVPAHPVV